MSIYLVPVETTRVETVVVNSRFIATAARATSVEEAKAFIQSIRNEMPDASHHVYAFKVGYGGSVIEGMSDDGEPSGTSGPPTLTVLRGADLGDTVIVVTRYFGGTKLGTGGLVRAYSGAAKQVLAALPVELKIPKTTVGISVAYTHYERLKLLLAEHQAAIENEEFAVDVTVYAVLPSNQLESLSNALTELTSGQVVPVVLDETPG
ncbi:YigZ family protein [Aggregatilinea lenta]|uniref:YigZ family protein n=1 Tax=Aggregatilinea lenta TaxID=913108 RepID=UPI0013C3566A|nr:YigZ family protein [Aggregatilinea lenta]